jgi:biopolymer transport protein ExbD
MNFRKTSTYEPEINFIPLIDVLLVIVIFLMVSTTFTQQKQLKITLPSANPTAAANAKDKTMLVSINDQGVYSIDQRILETSDVTSLSQELKMAAADSVEQPTIVINADAKATHQSVVNILEAARVAELSKITFLTQASK